jgi:hypothetical protein
MSMLAILVKGFDEEGNIIAEEYKKNDLYLWNFAVFLTHWMKRWNNTSDATTYEYIDIDGTARTISSYVYSSQNMVSYNDPGTYQGVWGNTLKALVGSNATTPTITDYQLYAQVAEALPTAPALITSGSILKQLFSATFPMAAETICAEVGLKMASQDTYNGGHDTLITRDIFSPVTVPAGGSLTVQFEFWWNGTPT